MLKLLPLLCTLLLLTGCASSNFTAYDDGGQIYRGTGGAKEVINGIDIWKEGSPPRSYKIIGILKDQRRDALLTRGGTTSAIVSAVKANGGDAAIILSEGSHQVGTYTAPGMSTTTYSGTARPAYSGSNDYRVSGTARTTSAPGNTYALSDKITRVAIIKYVTEAGTPTPPTTLPENKTSQRTEAEKNRIAHEKAELARKRQR